MPGIYRLIGAVIALLAVGLFTPPAAAQSEQPKVVAIVGADVLTMTSPELLSDHAVLVQGDRIIAVGPRAEVDVPSGATVIDASGMTLMPGLVDMHVHIADDPGQSGDRAARALSLMLANGVTTARSMVGGPGHPGLRDRINQGEVLGPTLIVGAQGVSATNIQTAEAVREHVRMAAVGGFDFVKIFSVANLTVWDALVEESRALRIPVGGHVSNVVGLDRALASGMQMEHLDSTLLALLPADSPYRDEPFGQFPSNEIIAVAAGATDAQMDAMARSVAASGSYQVPTLALFDLLMSPEVPIPVLRARPEMRFIPTANLDAWETLLGGYRTRSQEQADRFLGLRRRIVAAFHRAGVPIMAGTDGPQAFHPLGEGYIQELEALVVAGLPRMEVLRSATVVPRDYLRSLQTRGAARVAATDFGTIEPGLRADLLLVRGDPSVDLDALRDIQTVILRGRVFDRAALDAMLEEVALAAQAANAPPATGQ